jgi:hypothetical protein
MGYGRKRRSSYLQYTDINHLSKYGSKSVVEDLIKAIASRDLASQAAR